MEQIIPASYQELFEIARHFNDLEKPDIEVILKSLGFKGYALSAQAPVFYIIDYSMARYLFIDASSYQVLGYASETLIERGPSHILSYWHPSDKQIFEQKVFPEAMRFLKDKQPQDYSNYSFTCNYRFKAGNGNWLTLLQRSTYFLASESGTPLAAVGFVVDISDYKENTSMIHVVEKVDRSLSSLSKTPLLRSIYYPDASGKLSSREMQLLKLLAEGYSSKEIADQLSISIHTVNNHRKNMLEKTNTRNVSELMHYAQKTKIL